MGEHNLACCHMNDMYPHSTPATLPRQQHPCASTGLACPRMPNLYPRSTPAADLGSPGACSAACTAGRQAHPVLFCGRNKARCASVQPRSASGRHAAEQHARSVRRAAHHEPSCLDMLTPRCAALQLGYRRLSGACQESSHRTVQLWGPASLVLTSRQAKASLPTLRPTYTSHLLPL